VESCTLCKEEIWVNVARDPAKMEGMTLVCSPCGVTWMKQVALRGEPVHVLPGSAYDQV
jgi:hypothetical protein